MDFTKILNRKGIQIRQLHSEGSIHTGYLWDVPGLLALGATIHWQAIVWQDGKADRRVCFSPPELKMGEGGHQIFTWGYQGREVTELQTLLIQHQAVVFDARLKPVSRFSPQWNRKALQATLGEQYIHIPEWGNLNYKAEIAPKGEIVLSDFEAGVNRLKNQLQFTSIFIMCVCKNHHTCHRTTIAKNLRALGYQVQEYQVKQEALI